MKLRTSFACSLAFACFAVTTARAQTVLDIAARSGGNLRVDLRCADYWATPAEGLRVTVDGVETPTTGVNWAEAIGYTRHGNPYTTSVPNDVGYVVAAGMHHIELSAPGCATDARDVDVWPLMPRTISGRLATTDSSLLGPVGAPNGLGMMFGAYMLQRPAHGASNDLFSSQYQFDATTNLGGMMSVSYEHRSWMYAIDTRFGGQSSSGTASATGAIDGRQNRGPFAFSGTTYGFGNALRVGRRIALGEVALEAGTGIGYDVGFGGGTLAKMDPVNDAFVASPDPVDGDWYVPLWAGATIKPSCDWGVQVLASYELHPTSTSESSLGFGAGLIYQPSAACSEPPGLSVR